MRPHLPPLLPSQLRELDCPDVQHIWIISRWTIWNRLESRSVGWRAGWQGEGDGWRSRQLAGLRGRGGRLK